MFAWSGRVPCLPEALLLLHPCDRVSCVSDVLPLLASCDRVTGSCDRVFPGRTVYRVPCVPWSYGVRVWSYGYVV